jgi:hypothetical protein
VTQHEPTHSRAAIIADLACIIGEMADLQAEQARLSERQAAMQSRLGKMIRDLSTTTAVIRTPITPETAQKLQRAIREAPQFSLLAERDAPAAQAATPADIQPQAQSEGEPVRVGKASDEVPVRGAGVGHRAGQSEELRHDAEAGGESAASADTASAPDERKKRRRLPSSADLLAEGAKYRNSEKPADPIVAAARHPSVKADGGGLVQDGGSTGETRGDQVLNLWAETTLAQDEIARKLGVNSGTPAAYLSTARRAADPRALKGDLARAALRPPRHEIPDGKPALINLDTGQITGAAGSWTADRAVAKAINVLADGQLYDTSRMAKVSGIKEDAIVASMGIWASALAKIGVELRYQRGYGCRLLAIQSEAA